VWVNFNWQEEKKKDEARKAALDKGKKLKEDGSDSDESPDKDN
jgi:hypothetical protein